MPPSVVLCSNNEFLFQFSHLVISSDYFQPPTPSPSSRRGVVPRTSSSPGSSGGGAASGTPHVVIGQVANLGHVTLSGGRAGSTTTHVVEASFQPRDPIQLKLDSLLFRGSQSSFSLLTYTVFHPLVVEVLCVLFL